MEVVGSYETHIDSTEHIPNDPANMNMVVGGQETRSNKEQLTIPSQVAQPKCLEEATMKMNNDILTNTIEESLNFPLHPIVWNNEHVHYYVDHWGVEEQNAYFEEPPGEDNTKEALHLVDHPIQLDITPVINRQECQIIFD